MSTQITQFFDACYPFGYPLLACSVLILSAIIYHYLARDSKRSLNRLENTALEDVIDSCQKHPSLLGQELLFIAQNKQEGDEVLQNQVEARLRLYIDSQRRALTTISVITNIAPMLGILGTAWGLVDIFGIFASPEAQEGIAIGISKALYTTIFGLAIAVPGVIILSAAERSLEEKAARISVLFSHFLAKRHQL